MANGLYRPDFDAPTNPSNEDPAGDGRRAREQWVGVLVPTVLVAASALAIAGLIDFRAAGVDRGPDVADGDVVAGRHHGGKGAAGAGHATGTSVSSDPVDGLVPIPTMESMGPVAIRPDRHSTSADIELRSSASNDVGITTSTDRDPARTTPSVPTRRSAPSTAVPTASSRIPDNRSAPASTAALESSTSSVSVGSTSITVESAEVDNDRRFRRFVAEAKLEGVDFVTPHLAHGTRVTGDQRINVLVLDHPATAGIRVSPGGRAPAPVGTWAAEVGAQAAINANWFTGGGGFDGPFVAGGKVHGGRDHHYTALFGFTAEKRLVTEHHSVVNDTVDDQVVEAVAGHPTLVDRGRVTSEFGADPTFTRRHPRTAIGSSHGGDIVIFVTVDGRSSRARGMTGAETAALMAELGASHAVMLDGGGSSAMWIEGRGVVNAQSDTGRRVGNQIAIFGR